MKDSKFNRTAKSKESLIEDGNAEIEDHLLKLYKVKTALVVDKIKEIGLPKKNEQIRIVTMKSFNSISIIDYIANKEAITKMILVIFAINLQAAKLILELYRSGKIKNIELVVSSIRNAGHSIKSKAVELLSKEKNIKLMFVNSHAKVSALQTEQSNYYVIEGSGNLSYNGRIEQYVIDNDKSLFEFTESWISEIKRTMKTKDLEIIN